jgi:hypothetical protein
MGPVPEKEKDIQVPEKENDIQRWKVVDTKMVVIENSASSPQWALGSVLWLSGQEPNLMVTV